MSRILELADDEETAHMKTFLDTYSVDEVSDGMDIRYQIKYCPDMLIITILYTLYRISQCSSNGMLAVSCT